MPYAVDTIWKQLIVICQQGKSTNQYISLHTKTRYFLCREIEMNETMVADKEGKFKYYLYIFTLAWSIILFVKM